MKRKKLSIVFIVSLFILNGCIINHQTDKETAFQIYTNNEDLILSSIQNNDFSEMEDMEGLEGVYPSMERGYVEFICGGAGFGSSTSYYGFFYSSKDDMAAWNGGICSKEALVPFEAGFKYLEENGDNSYYVEKIAEHFYYFEVSF